MKAKFLFFICIFLIVTMFIYYNLHQYINNYDIVLVDNLNYHDNKEVKICLLNKNNEFELIDVIIPDNSNEEEYIVKLMDEKRNSLPLGYTSVVFDTLNIKSVERNDNVINIKVDKINNKTNINDFLVSLIWSYKYLGIEEVNLITDNKTYSVNKDVKINPIYLSTKPQSVMTFYEFNENGVVPYTIFHEKDNCFLLMDLIGIKYEDYKLELKNNEIDIYLNKKYDTLIIDQIRYNFTCLELNKKINLYVNNEIIK